MKCLFSNEQADTEEHIIPKWLQKKYNLYNQLLTIPNGTRIPYTKVKIPVRSEDNLIFGNIEKNISEGKYNIDEIYLWGFKIHIGLLMMDSKLKINRKDSYSDTIFNIEDFSTQLDLFQKLYSHWKDGKTTLPKSIGSVFILNSTLDENQFDFVHCIKTNTILISFNRICILVFLFDNNDAFNHKIDRSWNNDFINRPNISKEEKYIAQRVWACENSYHAYKRMRDIHLKEVDDTLVLQQTEPHIKGEYSKDEFSKICKMFGIVLEEYNNFAINRYNVYVE